ncbi:relaxase/mobilization nuclease domain-containing protein [Acetobacterium woodii]|uniref:Endonuclease relaxase n=1 Tax=Acetobacterium woodii (strain ATCC 29683 / DSM 1030 / JCM 2381 / KCTC 1655 / WB1) TaxID=931626 RepID=H6LDD1_ACEWD|nr:relaxase/mobilization nuclease domain-containing protein [Acetobacterium woodii]AFA47903.1 endonuclease relaxase [Acetobacterium woodii DSM 1030]
MAIIKMLNSKTKQSAYSMKQAVGYALKMNSVNFLASGINCNFDTAYEEFVLTKKMHHKENGRLYIHFEQSFPPDTTATAEQLHEIGRRLIEESSAFDGFQVVIGTHTDKDHIHNHFVINSVNAESGLKWHQSKFELLAIREKSLELCKEANINVWWDKQLKNTLENDQLSTVNYGEYEKQKQGKSWKFDLFQTIKECMKASDSKDQFIKAMRSRGYDVDWTDRHKYITFTTPEGMKCRNDKLYPIDKFTKTSLLKQIEKKDREEIKDPQEMSDAKKQKSDCYNAIMLCAKHSHSKDEFINNMEGLGYGVQWDHHVHLVFATPKGKRFREDKFYPADRFSKEKLLLQFEKNADRRSQRTKLEHQKEMNQVILNVKSLLAAVKSQENSKTNQPIAKLEKKKNLEGQALKEKAIEKSNTSYDWETDWEI